MREMGCAACDAEMTGCKKLSSAGISGIVTVSLSYPAHNVRDTCFLPVSDILCRNMGCSRIGYGTQLYLSVYIKNNNLIWN